MKEVRVVGAGPDPGEAPDAEVLMALPAKLARSVELVVGLLPELDEDPKAFVERAVRERLSRMIVGASPIPAAPTNMSAPAPRAPTPPHVLAARRARADRAAPMYERYRGGETLREIGRSYGLTRERIRQILRDAGYPAPSAEDLLARRRTAETRPPEEVVDAYKRSGDAAEVARRLGLSASAVRRVLAARLGPLTAAYRARRPAASRIGDEELLGMLREAAGSAPGPLTIRAYDLYARAHTPRSARPWPGAQAVQVRFGSWVRALQAAGLRTNPSSPIAHRYRFDAEACVRAVRSMMDASGGVPTTMGYALAAAASGGGLPSVATVRHRLGSWSAALRAAAESSSGAGMRRVE
jgi:hypothetical protein